VAQVGVFLKKQIPCKEKKTVSKGVDKIQTKKLALNKGSLLRDVEDLKMPKSGGSHTRERASRGGGVSNCGKEKSIVLFFDQRRDDRRGKYTGEGVRENGFGRAAVEYCVSLLFTGTGLKRPTENYEGAGAKLRRETLLPRKTLKEGCESE